MTDNLTVTLPEGIAIKLCPRRLGPRRRAWCVDVVCGDVVIDCFRGWADEETARYVAGVLKEQWERRRQ